MRIVKAFPPREVQTSPERNGKPEKKPFAIEGESGKKTTKAFFLSFSADLKGALSVPPYAPRH